MAVIIVLWIDNLSMKVKSLDVLYDVKIIKWLCIRGSEKNMQYSNITVWACVADLALFKIKKLFLLSLGHVGCKI